MNLFYGTLNIVTGISGSGKSSFLSQVICQAAEQGQNVWYYSGELPNFMARNWVDYVFASQCHLMEYTYNDETHWKVSARSWASISSFYENRIYIYKDSLPHSVSSLMQSMEETVRKYGAKLCVLDNVTSVNLECGEENKYERQARFVESLISFAVRFQVAVILVVHPHKIETMRRMTKMDGDFSHHRRVRPANYVGVVDSDYRREVVVALRNEGYEWVTFSAGDRVAQLVIHAVAEL